MLFSRQFGFGVWPRVAAGGGAGVPDPNLMLHADRAWRAADATQAAGVTQTLPPYIGSLTLTKLGSGQAPPAVSVNFNGALGPQVVVPFASGLGGYSAALATPAAYTFASVVRATGTNSAVHDLNAAGVVNTGTSSGPYGGTPVAFAQKLVVAALRSVATQPVNVLMVARFDATRVAMHANSIHGTTTAQAGALVGDTLVIGGLGNGNTFPLKGEWVQSAMWDRYLTDAEVVQWLQMQSARFAVSLDVDPFNMFAADAAWDAQDAVTVGAVTDTLPPFRGATTLTRRGTGQAPKTIEAALNGRFAVPFDGLSASGSYTGVPFGVAPANCTMVSIFRQTANNAGLGAVTVGGAVNNGFSQLQFTGQNRSRKLSADVTASAVSLPQNLVFVTLFSAAGCTHYANAITPVTVAQAGALTGTTFDVGALGAASIFTVTGAWARSGLWSRALSTAEVTYLLQWSGARYGVTIAP